MIPAKHFYMIRHGETEANKSRIMAGSLDSPLTELGRMQARDARKIVVSLKIKPQIIVHSHLSRARETAKIINEGLGVELLEDPDLAELHAGDWEGVPFSECQATSHGWNDPPNGETYDNFFRRIRRGKNKALSGHKGPVLIVCHGGVFRGFGKIFGIDSYGVRNCHLYEFEPYTNQSEPEKDAPLFPWKTWHYEYYDGQNEALLCDCTLEVKKPMQRPSALKPPSGSKPVQDHARIYRTACNLYHTDNISSDSPLKEIAR